MRSWNSKRRSCIATSATFRQPTLAHRASLSTQHIRSSGFSGCWSDGLELSQMNSEIRRAMSTASNSSLKQSCSAFTSATCALEVNFNVMRSINLRITYSSSSWRVDSWGPLRRLSMMTVILCLLPLRLILIANLHDPRVTRTSRSSYYWLTNVVD